MHRGLAKDLRMTVYVDPKLKRKYMLLSETNKTEIKATECDKTISFHLSIFCTFVSLPPNRSSGLLYVTFLLKSILPSQEPCEKKDRLQ